MIRLGIIGTGKIVPEALQAMAPVEGLQKQAIFARPHSAEKAEKIAAEFEIPDVYTDYDALLHSDTIDAVYIALVNSAHYEYAKKALQCGKHVLLEKPFVVSSEEAGELQETARTGKLVLMEAITVLHNPVFGEMRKNLPRLGNVKLALCNYSQYSSRYDSYLKGEVSPAFDPALAGGALRDINLYNIHYCVGLFGMPETVSYYPNRGFNGVDTSGALVMTYPGFHCICTGAKDSDSPSFVSIQGEKGWMRVNGKPNAAVSLETVSVDEKTGTPLVKDASGAVVRSMTRENYSAPAQHRMTEEFRDFVRMIETDDREEAERLLNESVSVVRVLEMASGTK